MTPGCGTAEEPLSKRHDDWSRRDDDPWRNTTHLRLT
jgi:hypothetical protein